MILTNAQYMCLRQGFIWGGGGGGGGGGHGPPPVRSAKIKVICVKTLNFRHVIDTRLPVHYDMYLLEGNIRKMLLLLN